MLKGQRYIDETVNPDFLTYVEKRLPYLSYRSACTFYAEAVPNLSDNELAVLGCNDRFWLLTSLLRRKDAIHPWIYDRCREVEESPDDHLDLWARYHYKSSIITFAGTIQDIVVDPEITVGIFSMTKQIARPFLVQIKEELETNEALKRIYADVLWGAPDKESPLWSSDQGIIVKRLGNPREATVEAHGLIDALPTGKHFRMLKFDDMLNEHSVSNPDQIKKTTDRYELSDSLGVGETTRKQYAGTRYCTIGSTRILMADWTHKPIAEVRPGEKIVGWKFHNGKRYLSASLVLNCGSHAAQPIRKFTFGNGRSVACTADHKWWRGPWGSGAEYQPLGMKRLIQGKMRYQRGKRPSIQQLLVPVDRDQSREAGWLAGFFDGEGTIQKNKNHPSGTIHIIQTMHNPGLIDEVRRILLRLKFRWIENWHSPSKAADGQEHWKDRCSFVIEGGWRERYRFMAQIGPARREKLEATLFAQLSTERLDLVADDDAGEADVFWLETETGNYVAEGFCSSNSFADSYGILIERGVVKPRVHPATDDGKLTGNPVFMSKEGWEKVKKTQRSQVAAQMLLNPLAGEENMFVAEWLRPYEVRPALMNVYILGDPSMGRTKSSDRTAIAVIGIDALNNRYFLDGFCHRMKLSQRWQAVKEMHNKWSKARGVQMVRIGYERYGMQTDLEYFDEQIIKDRIEGLSIEEVSWTREGGQSKAQRVGRLEPYFRNSQFWMMPKVWAPEHGGLCTWEVDANTSKIVYKTWKGPSRAEQEVIGRGEHYRVMEPVRRLDEDKNVYDLFRVFAEEYLFFPFSPRDDLIDATSRIEDMEPVPPMMHEAIPVETATYPD